MRKGRLWGVGFRSSKKVPPENWGMVALLPIRLLLLSRNANTDRLQIWRLPFSLFPSYISRIWNKAAWPASFPSYLQFEIITCVVGVSRSVNTFSIRWPPYISAIIMPSGYPLVCFLLIFSVIMRSKYILILIQRSGYSVLTNLPKFGLLKLSKLIFFVKINLKSDDGSSPTKPLCSQTEWWADDSPLPELIDSS